MPISPDSPAYIRALITDSRIFESLAMPDRRPISSRMRPGGVGLQTGGPGLTAKGKVLDGQFVVCDAEFVNYFSALASKPDTSASSRPSFRKTLLRRPRECRAKSKALHQRDGELSACHNIGNACAGDCSHERGGEDADLCPTATHTSDQSKCEIIEERNHDCAFERGGEPDEDEDIDRGNIDRRAIGFFGAVGGVVDDLVVRIARWTKGSGRYWPVKQ